MKRSDPRNVRGIWINKGRDGIDNAFVLVPADGMQKRPVNFTDCSFSAESPVVRPSARIYERLELVAALVVIREIRPAVMLRRIADIETNPLVLWQDGEIEIAEFSTGVVAVQPGH